MAKRGRPSKEEVKFVQDNNNVLTTLEIAGKLDRSEEFVLKIVGQPQVAPLVDEKQAEIDRLNLVVAEQAAKINANPSINMHKVELAGFAIRKDDSGKSKGIVVATEQAGQKSDEKFSQKKTTNVTMRKFSDAIHHPNQ